ncbi:MAG: hypothetical protein FJ147_05065 [Deltaproteobacteria bacterium]|nr:hypothetical protein [Deltaproteobacteria bacterium]
MKKGAMKRLQPCSVLLALFLVQGIWVAGCVSRPRPKVVEVAPTEAPRPPQRTWVGERAKVVIFEFDNKLAVETSGKRGLVDAAFGSNLKKHLVMGLQQTEQFAVLDPRGAKRVLTAQDFTPAGEIKRKLLQKLGPFEGAEFLIAGSVTAYQPSQTSLRAGLDADPLLGGKGVKQGGKTTPLAKAFASLPVAKQDRISIELRLIEAATGKIIETTVLEGTPQELSQPRGGLFDEKFSTPSGTLSTPMQKALRVCTIKAVDWIAETGLAHRGRAVARPAPLPPPGEKPTPRKKLAVEKPVVEKPIGDKSAVEPPVVEKPVVDKPSVREKLVREPAVKKQEVSKRSLGEKPTVENPSPPKPVAELPVAEKPVPKKEVPRSEEWGQ